METNRKLITEYCDKNDLTFTLHPTKRRCGRIVKKFTKEYYSGHGDLISTINHETLLIESDFQCIVNYLRKRYA